VRSEAVKTQQKEARVEPGESACLRPSAAQAPKPRRTLTRAGLWKATPRPVRQALRGLLDAIPPRILLGRDFRRCRRFLREAQWWDRERAQRYQLERLREICALAYSRTVFYRRLFDSVGFLPFDLRSLDDLAGMPIIDKDTLREHLDEMCATPPGSRGVDSVSTGGTSGVPFEFYINANRSPVEYAYLTASWNRVGYEVGVPMAVFRGRIVPENSEGVHYEYEPILRCHHFSNFHMTDENMRVYLDRVRAIGPCYLHVYPSSASALARFVRRSGVERPVNIRGIIAESEIVYPEQRALVEETFGCRLFSCYGHSEKLVLASECEHSTDDHVWPTYGYLELVDENGRPVTEPGRRGEIVGTGFHNTVMPFIRYRTGDLATYVADRCEACGREHVVIREIRGHRTQEMLVASDGSEISWTALNMHDDTFANVRCFQFYQDTPGRAVLRIVPSPGFGEQDRRRVATNLGAKLTGRVEFTIETTDAILLSPRGKAVYVDQRIVPTVGSA
jgi:phenylacetate-CoA ligase